MWRSAGTCKRSTTTPVRAVVVSCSPKSSTFDPAPPPPTPYTLPRMATDASPPQSRDVPLTGAMLRDIGLFGALADEVVDHLAKTLKTMRATPGDTIFREGDPAGREM